MNSPSQRAEGGADFDFFVGHWNVHHRRLRERLAGCDEWDTFGGTSVMTPLLGGHGNVDDNVIDLLGGSYRAASLRAYDPAQRQWSIWWLDSRLPGPLDPPMVGSFVDGNGTFYADETFAGRPIRVRFCWTKTLSATPRWEQAFSTDGGETWEVNWTMDFSRPR